MSFAPTKLPKFTSPRILKASGRLSPDQKPEFIPVRSQPQYSKNKCAFNAKAEAEEVGGKVIFGWYVVTWENVLAQFVGHAVVEKSGEIYCVTGNDYSESQILFVRDESIQFDYSSPDARLPSKTFALSSKVCVKKFIDIEDEQHAIKLKYPVTSDSIVLSQEDSAKFKKLESLKQYVLGEVLFHHHGIKEKCPCGSGRQFRKCCRPNMAREFGGGI